MSKNLTADERKILEDFRSRKAQRTASRVTKSGIDPNERLRLARERQKETDRVRRETQSEANRRISQAQDQARQARTAQQERDRLAELDRKRIAEAQKKQQAQEFARQQQLALTQNTSLRPTQKQAELSRKVTQFLAERKQQEQQKSEKKIQRVKKSVFRKEPRESIGSVVRVVAKDLPKPTIRQLTDEQKRSPQFMGGAVKEFLTKERQPAISLIPSVPEASAEEFRPSQNVPRRENFIPLTPSEKPPTRQTPIRRIEAGESFTGVIPNPNRGQIISTRELPDGSIETTREPDFISISGEKGSDQVVEQRPPKSRNFLEGFALGSQQELANFGNIADVVTGKEGTTGIKSRKEVGSTVIDLPFSVGGALFTEKAEEGKGVFGSDFNFAFNPTQAGEKFEEERKFIESEFERDTGRAVGSTVTALGIEAALLLGTGGTATVARKGIIKTAQFTTKSRQAKKVADLAKKLTPEGEKDIPILIERISENKYVIARGTDELAGLGAKVISPAEALVTQVTRTGKVISSKVPLLRTGGKGSKKIKFKESDIKKLIKEKDLKPNPADPRSAREQAIAELQKGVKTTVQRGESEIPVTLVEFSGKKGQESTVKFFNKRIPKDKGNIETKEVVVQGVTDSTRFLSKKVQKETGLKLVEIAEKLPKVKRADKLKAKFNVKDRLKRKEEAEKFKEVLKRSEESTTIAGQPTPQTLNILKEGEKSGFFELTARGIGFSLKDVTDNPKLINKLVRTQRTLTGRPSQLGKGKIPSVGKLGIEEAERRLAQQTAKKSVKVVRKRSDTQPLQIQTEDFFQAQALSVPKSISTLGQQSAKRGGKKSTTSLGDALSDTAKKTGGKAGKSADDIGKSNKGSGQRSIFDDAVKTETKTAKTQSNRAIREAVESKITTGAKTSKKTKTPRTTAFDDVARATSIGVRGGVISSQIVRGITSQETKDRLDTNVVPIIDTFNPLDTKKDDDRDNIPVIIRDPKRIVTTEQDLGVGLVPIIDTIVDTKLDDPQIIITKTPEITTTKTPTPFITPLGARPPTFAELRKKEAKRKRSGQGKRLFDVAKTPFGKVTVGLGFFIEQKGDETIAEAIGVPEPKEPKKKKKKDADPLSAVFGQQSGQFDTTFQF